VFVAQRGDKRGIWRMNADGSEARLLLESPDATSLEVSPDGRTIYYTSSHDGSSSTWRVPIDGGDATLVRSLFDRAAVSPDGTRLAGIYRSGVGATLALAVIRLADAQPIHVFPDIPFPVQGGVLQWNPAGDGLLFTSAERANIWLQKLSGGPPVRVTNFADQTLFRANRSPDGKSLIVARGSQTRDAFLITNFR
jgi:Tol biopolymer transport system component